LNFFLWLLCHFNLVAWIVFPLFSMCDCIRFGSAINANAIVTGWSWIGVGYIDNVIIATYMQFKNGTFGAYIFWWLTQGFTRVYIVGWINHAQSAKSQIVSHLYSFRSASRESSGKLPRKTIYKNALDLSELITHSSNMNSGQRNRLVESDYNVQQVSRQLKKIAITFICWQIIRSTPVRSFITYKHNHL
jgi:hypothetical protein